MYKMLDNISYLKKLIGQSIKNIDVDFNTVISLKEKNDDRSDQLMSVYTLACKSIGCYVQWQ